LKTKVLVFGADGQVGTSFKRIEAKVCSLLNAEVFYSTHLGTSSGEIACDATDLKAVTSLVRSINPQIIINCAAYTAVDKSETDQEVCLKLNRDFPGHLAYLCKSTDAFLVHYSTDYVFDGSGSTPWREGDAPQPVNFYGLTKLEGEKAVQQNTPRHLIIRTQWVYSDHGHNFVKTMLRLAKERSELKVVGDQIGAPTSSDLIANLTTELLVPILRDQNLAGIYNLSASGEVSWHGFAEAIFKGWRKLGGTLAVNTVQSITTDQLPTPAKRPFNSRLNLSKLESVLQKKNPSWQQVLEPVLKKLFDQGF
jgi:dTDP-4-dehydrorhamnose reductase